MSVNFKPAGCQQVIPYLILNHPEKTIDFVKKVFGATESHVSKTPQGQIMHASMKIGDSVLMMGQGGERWPAMPAMIYIYVPDVDAAFQRAVAAGAKPVRQPETQFYGDRSGGVIDDQGVQWWIGTQVEVVSEQELQRRAQEMFSKAKAGN
ncbi:MAG TPA: VOC family protein [Terriglobales bacterium]|nr:VOC family protein [Terriglobales bacterium]